MSLLKKKYNLSKKEISIGLYQNRFILKKNKNIQQIILDKEALIIIDKEKLIALKMNKKSYWGLYNQLIANLSIGLHYGHRTQISLIGLGYRSVMKKSTLYLKLGYSNIKKYEVPVTTRIKCLKPLVISVYSIDLQELNQICDGIRSFRKPNVYKAKGIYISKAIKEYNKDKNKNK